MGRVVRVIGAALVAAAIVCAAVTAHQPDVLIVAYVTGDGELLPVGRYDGKRWINTWPKPAPRDEPLPARSVSEIPAYWLGQSVPLTWTVWTAWAKKTSRVSVTGLVRGGTCVGPVMLTTSPKPEPALWGLAFNRPTEVDAALTVHRPSPESERLRRDLAPHFRAAVGEAVPRYKQKYREERWSTPLPKALVLAQAAGVADQLVLREVFRDPRPQMEIFYLEAERKFAEISPDDADAVSFSGWFRRRTDGALVPIDAIVETMSTGEDKTPHLTPVGILRLDGSAIWVMSRSVFESSGVVLLGVSTQGIKELIAAERGGC